MRENHSAILVLYLEIPTFSTYKKAYRFLFLKCIDKTQFINCIVEHNIWISGNFGLLFCNFVPKPIKDMTKNELLRRLNDIEWNDFKVKEATGSLSKSMWKIVSAFPNTAGGWMIILGVKKSR